MRLPWQEWKSRSGCLLLLGAVSVVGICSVAAIHVGCVQSVHISYSASNGPPALMGGVIMYSSLDITASVNGEWW